eukprot:jgi/Botrbrau1/17985/Bobra.0460s0001.1
MTWLKLHPAVGLFSCSPSKFACFGRNASIVCGGLSVFHVDIIPLLQVLISMIKHHICSATPIQVSESLGVFTDVSQS